MPFEVGHTINNGRKREKPYAAALNMEIKAAAEADNPLKALRAVARAHLKKAANGDVAAITELANRLDGKVPQAVVGDDEHPPAFHAWLQWMQILAGDTRSLSPNANDINGLVTIEPTDTVVPSGQQQLEDGSQQAGEGSAAGEIEPRHAKEDGGTIDTPS